MRWVLLVAMASAGAGCSCGEDRALRVSGDTPYVRCHAAPPPEPGEREVGELRLRFDDHRRLRIEGAPNPPRLVAFAGPAAARDVAALARLRPDLVAYVGQISAEAVGALGALGVPVLVVAGGADERPALSEALSGAPAGIVDATVLRSVRAGKLELIPVAGAPEGRYATGRDACGLPAEDAEEWTDVLGDPEEGVVRVLLSWAGPRGEGGPSATAGLQSVEAGSALMAGIASEVGARAAIFAWPRTQAGRAFAGHERLSAGEGSPALRIGLPPLSGPAVVRADGSRMPSGPTSLTLRHGKLAVGLAAR